jgi:acetyl esterase/lipase
MTIVECEDSCVWCIGFCWQHRFLQGVCSTRACVNASSFGLVKFHLHEIDTYKLMSILILLSRFTSNALRDDLDKTNPRASVLLQSSFEGLPPCLFIVAELDPLRDDSYG